MMKKSEGSGIQPYGDGSPRESRSAVPLIRIGVECYAGYKGEETPRRLHFGHKSVEAVEIMDQWLAARHPYFKVRGANGAVYILRHNVAENVWELTMFASEQMRQSKPDGT